MIWILLSLSIFGILVLAWILLAGIIMPSFVTTVMVAFLVSLFVNGLAYRNMARGKRMSDIMDHSLSLMIENRSELSYITTVVQGGFWKLEIPESTKVDDAQETMLTQLSDEEARILVGCMELALDNEGKSIAMLREIVWRESEKGTVHTIDATRIYISSGQQAVIYVKGMECYPSGILSVVAEYPNCYLTFGHINYAPPSIRKPTVVEKIAPKKQRKRRT